MGRSETSRLSEITYKLMHGETEKNYRNLKRIVAGKAPKFDLLIAGFPCQTFSVIGRREGFDDDRGQIIFHLIRLMREFMPKVFILENVRGLTSHDKGKTMKIITTAIEEAGYSVTNLNQLANHTVSNLRLTYLCGLFSAMHPLPEPSIHKVLTNLKMGT